MSRRCCCLSALVLTGAVLFILGCVFIPVSKNLIHNQIVEQINLKSQTTYDNWVTNPTPIYFKVWVWDLTNWMEVQAGTGKPSLHEKGPFVYRESRKKVNVTFHDNNGTVTYRENQYFEFVPEMSAGPESTTFRTMNIPMMTIANIVKNEPGALQSLAETLFLLSKEELFITLNVSDLIWGYEEPLLKKAKYWADKLGYQLNDRFGLFTNGSNDGVYNVMTGATDASQFGIIKSWNYNSKLNFWTSSSCNMLNGTDGTIFHPFMKKSDTIYVFSSDICRSIYLTYLRSNSHKGIPTERFGTPAEVFLSGKTYSPNAGFCYPTSNDCLPSGLLNVENCRDGAPVVFSSPHFLYADPVVINSVIGVNPDPELHQTLIDIEPNTGAAFYAAKRLQVNLQMEKVNHIPQTYNLTNKWLPVIWIEESSTITDDLADEFKSSLQTPVKAINYGLYVAIGVGIVLIILTIVHIVVRRMRQKKYTELDEINETEYSD